MITYITTPHTVTPSFNNYNVVIDVVPVNAKLKASDLFWEHRDFFDNINKQFGEISPVTKDEKLYIGIHSAFNEGAPSTTSYKVGENWLVDDENSRHKAFISSLSAIKSIIGNLDAKIISPLLMSKNYKVTSKRHLANLTYFITYIEPLIPTELDWTVYYQKEKRQLSKK